MGGSFNITLVITSRVVKIPFYTLIYLGVVCILSTAGCASNPVPKTQSSGMLKIDSDARIIQLPAVVSVESVTSGKPISHDRVGTSSISTQLDKWIASEFAGAKTKLVTWQDPIFHSDTSLTGDDQTQKVRELVVRHKLTLGGMQLINKVCAGHENAEVFAQYLQVKVGSSDTSSVAGLPPISFSVIPRAPTDMSYYRATLRKCSDASTIWHGGILIRELPDVDAKNLRNPVLALYRDRARSGSHE